ncbi:Ig-like domain repeat protein [Amycolatopsis pigmentata]|uniref:Ig-like domain repeat protein n=1 Tax=Amycolatopsis pigmentata TaxID=450801 RepID=A0ABW5FTX8_9PSEU
MALATVAAPPAMAAGSPVAGLSGGVGGKPGAAARPLQGRTPFVSETFTGATADPNFVAVGSACLTGAPATSAPGPGNHPLGGCPETRIGPVPPVNGAPHGYLQLTDASTDQSGAVLYEHALPAAGGLNVTFDQWQYGTTTPIAPADGISFFLVDGAASLDHPGAFGGSLGYAQKLPDDNPANPFLPGVNSGYLGVGLDVLGNYFGDWEHRGNGCPPSQRSPAGTAFHVPAPGPNMVTVRGPGNGVEGYCFLTATTSNFTTSGPWPSTLPGQLQGPLTALPPGATPEQAETLLEPSRRRVNVQLTPGTNPTLIVTVDFNDGTGPHEVINTPAPEPVPETYKFGFAGSTGLFTDVHLIRNVVINSEVPLPPEKTTTELSATPQDATVGEPVRLTATVTCPGATPTGTVTFFSGTTELGTAEVIDGTAELTVSTLEPGQHTITAHYNGNGECEPSISNGVTVNVSTTPENKSKTKLSASASKVKPGDKVTLTATVTCDETTPTGTVTFFEGNRELTTVPLTDDTAEVTVRLPAGAHTFTARYNGDENCPPSTSNSVTVVAKGPGKPKPPHGGSAEANASQTVVVATKAQ